MRQLRSILPAVVLALAVTGCGGDDGDDEDADDVETVIVTGTPSVPTSVPTEIPTSVPTDVTTDDGGDDSGATGCILSDADVEAATGVEGAAEETSVAGATTCNWASATGASVNLTVTPGASASFDLTVSSTESVIGPSEEVSGVGDRAVVMFGSATVPQSAVIAAVGDQLVVLIFTAIEGDEETMKSAVVDLATLVADGL